MTFLALGAVAGVLAGLFGIGGGLVIVPALAFLLPIHGFGADKLMHVAIATSLATIVITSMASLGSHHRQGAVQWRTVRSLTPGIVAGTLLGTAIADDLSSVALRGVFAVFLLSVAVQMLLDIRPSAARHLPGAGGMAATGTVIGLMSALVGIGGGTLTTPFLIWCNVPLRQAIATSAACGLPIAVTGTLGYLLSGLNETGMPAYSTGYIYWPAFAGIAMTSVLCAPIGARLTHRVPLAVLKRAFAVLLIAVGLRLLY
jgi:uncharacterized membrane protein YfcA